MDEVVLVQERRGFPLSEKEVEAQKVNIVLNFFRFEVERRRKLIEPEAFLPGKVEKE